MRSFFVVGWSLPNALEWRRSFEPNVSVEQAFSELRALGTAGCVRAIGVRLIYRPDRLPAREPFAPLSSVDDLLEEIPADEWAALSLELDNQRPTGDLITTYFHLPAWFRVEIDRDAGSGVAPDHLKERRHLGSTRQRYGEGRSAA